MTRFKLVPPVPDTVDFVADAQRAVPLVPGTEDDCCARLLRRLDLPSRDVARTWLTFLRALELATESDAGFTRLQTEPSVDHLRTTLLDRVYGASEVYETLDANPQDAATVFEQFKTRVPTWEHLKEPTRWEDIWRDRTAELLEWMVLVGLADRVEDGYVRIDRQDD